MLLDGRAAALWGAGIGWPAFNALAKAGGHFIGPDADEVKRILAMQPALQAVTLPAGSYAGQDAPLHSVGSWSYVFAKPGLSDEAGYLLARTIHRAEAALSRDDRAHDLQLSDRYPWQMDWQQIPVHDPAAVR